MTKNNKMRVFCAAFAAVLILISMTACKKTTDVPVSDISLDTGATTEVAGTATTTDAAITEETASETTVATTKAPTTTTRTPNTTAKPVVNQTTKAQTTQTQTVKTQIDAMGLSVKVQTPEQICKERNFTMERFKQRVEMSKSYKCKYCDKHDCPSLVFIYATTGEAWDVSQNKWKCAAYVASEPKCDRCGKKLCEDYDTDHPKEEYCTGWHKQVVW